MARKIESLLRVIADMQMFSEGENIEQKQNISYLSNELTVADLDMIAAASQEPVISDFLKNEKK